MGSKRLKANNSNLSMLTSLVLCAQRQGQQKPWSRPLLIKMRQHLTKISEATHSDRYALVIIDGAGWHADDIAKEFCHLSVLKLPPYSPELQPIEQVWQWLRQHCLANRYFDGYNDIVEQCCNAWNTFIQCKDRVKSLCTRHWANMSKV